jgi:hypothetical protein
VTNELLLVGFSVHMSRSYWERQMDKDALVEQLLEETVKRTQPHVELLVAVMVEAHNRAFDNIDPDEFTAMLKSPDVKERLRELFKKALIARLSK